MGNGKIENDEQLKVTRDRIVEFKEGLVEIITRGPGDTYNSALLWELQINAATSVVVDLVRQKSEYINSLP